MKNLVLFFTFIAFLVGCSSLKKSVDYTVFGEANPSEEEKIVDRFVDSVKGKKDTSGVHVLANTLPDGADRNGNEITMDPDAKGEVLGKYSFKFSPSDSNSTQAKAIRHAKHLAQAAGGDTAVIFYEKDYYNTRRLHGASGYIFRLKPQDDSKKTKAL